MNRSIMMLCIILEYIIGTADGVCPVGTFGRKCRYSCHCESGACDVASGTCAGDCSTGWSGPSCQRENVAFNRTCHQKEGPNSQNASFAVDGDTSTCSVTKTDVPGWWTLTLDGVKRITSFTIITDYLSDFFGWKIYVGQDDHIFNMSPCTTIQLHDNGATLDCEEPAYGKYVKIVNRDGPVVICDFQIFECSPYTYDTMCSKTCNCADFTERCETRNGVCYSGCASGWTGSDCHEECRGHYGENCAYPCGHCRDKSNCDRFIGTCPDGCDPGWTSLLCNQPCQDGYFGVSCSDQCGHCYKGTNCNHINGTCVSGCQGGWSGSTCTKRCEKGTFGENCAHTCGHCLDQEACDPISGVCENGCEPGWEGLFCTQECLPGFYGHRCLESCENCFEGRCHKITGRCLQGCEHGRMGVDCTEECEFDSYGINCSSKCDRCNKGHGRLCNVTSGLCTYGCLPGFNGTNCMEACEDGQYGVNCVSKCGACYPGTMCNKSTGHCPKGCATNFFGDLCIDTEAFTDDAGDSQLQVFLGTTLGFVGALMTLVTVCLVLVWRREQLPKVEKKSSTPKEVVRTDDQNGRLICAEPPDEIEDEF